MTISMLLLITRNNLKSSTWFCSLGGILVNVLESGNKDGFGTAGRLKKENR